MNFITLLLSQYQRVLHNTTINITSMTTSINITTSLLPKYQQLKYYFMGFEYEMNGVMNL